MKEFWVSFHTAIALKKSGFTSPVPACGQFWYSEYGRLVTISETGDWLVLKSGLTNDTTFFPKDNPPTGKDAYYAPTAIDFISQMPQIKNVYSVGGNLFSCIVETDEGIKTYVDINSAEACAKAWFDLHPEI